MTNPTASETKTVGSTFTKVGDVIAAKADTSATKLGRKAMAALGVRD